MATTITKKHNPDRLPVEKLTPVELMGRAQKWMEERKQRAAFEFVYWKMMPDMTLVHRIEDKIYHCEDVRRLEFNPGVAIPTGCDCDDERGHLSRLRKALDEAGIVQPMMCKHHFIRLLWSGHTIRVGNYNIRVKDSLFKM